MTEDRRHTGIRRKDDQQKPEDFMTPEEQKRILKQALQEWLDAKYAEFGKWTARGIAASVLAGMIAYSVSHGFSIQDVVKLK